MSDPRDRVKKLAGESLDRGDPTGWFDALYREARRDASAIPWADLRPTPAVADWLDREPPAPGARAIVVGCGLGDDALLVARRGLPTTAFDVSETAVAWCRDRFPEAPVVWVVADLFAAPAPWAQAFDLVIEVNTLQALPLALRPRAIEAVASLVAPGGACLVVGRLRDDEVPPALVPGPPWPLSRGDLAGFQAAGLVADPILDAVDGEGVGRVRVVQRRPATAAP